jgi:large subunit ribosomal protein L30
MIAVVRVRGIRKVNPKIRKTLELLRLNRPNHCVVLKGSKQDIGMLRVVKDYIAFGEIDEETLFRLLYKRGTKGSKKLKELMEKDKIKEAAKGIAGGKTRIPDIGDPVFMLHPPRKGYRNTKKMYPFGDLGKRDDMNLLLRRMM